MCALFLFSCGTSPEHAIHILNKRCVMETHPFIPTFSQTHPAVNPQIESFTLKGRVLRIQSPLKCLPLSTCIGDSALPPLSPCPLWFLHSLLQSSPQIAALNQQHYLELVEMAGTQASPRPLDSGTDGTQQPIPWHTLQRPLRQTKMKNHAPGPADDVHREKLSPSLEWPGSL